MASLPQLIYYFEHHPDLQNSKCWFSAFMWQEAIANGRCDFITWMINNKHKSNLLIRWFDGAVKHGIQMFKLLLNIEKRSIEANNMRQIIKFGDLKLFKFVYKNRYRFIGRCFPIDYVDLGMTAIMQNKVRIFKYIWHILRNNSNNSFQQLLISATNAENYVVVAFISKKHIFNAQAYAMAGVHDWIDVVQALDPLASERNDIACFTEAVAKNSVNVIVHFIGQNRWKKLPFELLKMHADTLKIDCIEAILESQFCTPEVCQVLTEHFKDSLFDEEKKMRICNLLHIRERLVDSWHPE